MVVFVFPSFLSHLPFSSSLPTYTFHPPQRYVGIRSAPPSSDRAITTHCPPNCKHSPYIAAGRYPPYRPARALSSA
ncbi:hypothetical protein K438DRAFT_1811940 [Mycena galopus ATCC 62051]|nr:hypothetical protein K438DRAFT_1811940 [Mycena galopus ATCC 62051]